MVRASRPIALQVIEPAPSHRPRSYGRWRAACLAGVYVLMGLHIAHWKIAGQTLAPLELNEVMYTFELGIVTAGFLFMLAACIATAIFGRFFCSWGCHILALEDACAWLLGRVGIRPRRLRSRLLLLVPAAAVFYMFIWPQIARAIWPAPPIQLHLRTDAQGWASFVTSNFWRNLPDPWVAGLTFLICGFAIVYVLGARAFCTYGCPYGFVFRMMDKLAPGRMVVTDRCTQCGRCTAACTSGVRVHEELARYGAVVNSACLKDLDCVSACPYDGVRYGFTRPPAFRAWLRTWTLAKKPDFTRAEEVLLAGVFVITLLVFRGLYDAGPFLMTLGLGAILALLAVLTLRLLRSEHVKLGHFWLKTKGRIQPAGRAFVFLMPLLAAFVAHSGFVRYQEYFGHAAAERVEKALHGGQALRMDLQAAVTHLDAAARWGLVRSERLIRRLGAMQGLLGEEHGNSGDLAGAERHLREALRWTPGVPGLHYNLGVMLMAQKRDTEAIREFETAARQDPNDADIHNNLGFVVGRCGDAAQAEAHFREALRVNPNHAHAHFNLGRLLYQRGRHNEAAAQFEAAARLDATYAEILGVPR